MKSKADHTKNSGDDLLPPPVGPLACLPPEAIFERLPSGAAGRAKIEHSLSEALPANFYFAVGELIKTGRKDVTNMRLTGCEYRQAKSGPRAGRWVIPIKGTERTVVVTPAEIQAFEDAEAAARLRDLRGARQLNRAQLTKPR